MRPKEDPAASWVTHKRNCRACRFQWRVSQSHCEYSGVTYDLLVSNIGGTYDLANQLPSNHEFGNFLVVSQSLVPREFGVSLASSEAFKGRRAR